MAEDQLSKNDLYILMESYKNNIQLNTTLLEQQKQLLIMTNESIDKQKDLCLTLDKFIENLTNCSKRMDDNHNAIMNRLSNVNTQVTTTSATNSVEHSKITNRIYVAFGGMVLIILAVIDLAMTYSDKLSTVAEQLAKHIRG